MDAELIQTFLGIVGIMAGAVIWICKALMAPIAQRLDVVVETLKDMRQDYRDEREERIGMVKKLSEYDARITKAHQRLDDHDERIETLENTPTEVIS